MAEIRFVLGRAGSGKTHLCLDLIARRLRASPLEGDSIILLVPEQAAYQMERTLASWRGINNGFARAKVLSFRRLIQLIAKETGTFSGRFLLSTSRFVLMSQIIAAAQQAGRLRFWNNCEPAEIAETVVGLLDELSSSGLTIDILKRKYEELTSDESFGNSANFLDKLNDIIILAEQYEKTDTGEFVDRIKYISEGQKLINKADWLKGAIIFVDGFSGFTGVEYELLISIAKVAKQCFISLCLDYDMLGRADSVVNRNCFWLTEQTYARLTKLASDADIHIGRPVILGNPARRRFKRSRQLAEIEKSVRGPIIVGANKSDSLQCVGNDLDIIAAETPLDEIEFVANRIIELVRDRGYRYRDISVILRSLNDYEALIRYVFDRYDIPYFIDIRRPVSQHPLAKLIISALAAVGDNFSSKWIIKYIKTGLTDVDNWLVGKLENYILAHGIDKDDWHKEWRYKPLWIGREDVDDIEGNISTAENILTELNNARQEIIRPLKQLQSAIGLDRDNAYREIDINIVIDAIGNLLRGLKIPQKIGRLAKARQIDDAIAEQLNKQILNVIVELFSQLRITLSGQLLSIDEVINVLQQSFAVQTIGVIPSCIDQVLVGTIERSRHPAVKASFILGYNESNWPAPIKEDVILTDSDRKMLNWQDLALNADIEEHYLREQYLNYIALTRPQEYLWISYSACNMQGVELRESRFLKKLIDSFGIRVKKDYTTRPLSISGFVSSCVSDIKIGEGKEIEKYSDIFGISDEMFELLCNYWDIAFDDNNPTLSGQLGTKLFSSVFSLSRIETYYKCAFQHFCRYGLKLKDKIIYRLEPVDLGILRHQVLREFWQKVVDKNIPLSELTEQFVSDVVEQAVKQASAELKKEHLLEEARNVFLIGQITEELKAAITSQIENLKPGRFMPILFEYSFDVLLDDASLTGRIDRIDVCEDEKWILVIDYKSKANKFYLEDAFAGISLQLPGYLWALKQLDDFSKYSPAGAFIISLSGDFKAGGFANEQAIECFITGQMSNSSCYNIKLKKDGSLTSNSQKFVFEDELIRNLLNQTADMINTAIKEIYRGNISIYPYYNGKYSVCSNCGYMTICRFARGINRYRVLSSANIDAD